MRKRMKNVMIVLGATALIVAAAYLPHIAAAVHDGENRQAQFAQINAVELDIREKLTALGKLSLMRWLASGIELPEEDASMTAEEAYAAAYAGFEPYYSSGLMLPFEESYNEFYPLLVRDPERPERYMIVWEGMIIQRVEPFGIVMLGIDDETGQILYLVFRSEDVVSTEAGYEAALTAVSEIFFQNLGITEYQTRGVEVAADDNTMTGIEYRFYDESYGSFAVDFIATGNGFEIEFSK